MSTIKKALKSRTVLFAIALSILSVWQGLLGSFNLDPVTQGVVGSLISVCIVVLRFLTTQPISEKE